MSRGNVKQVVEAALNHINLHNLPLNPETVILHAQENCTEAEIIWYMWQTYGWNAEHTVRRASDTWNDGYHSIEHVPYE